MIHMPTQDLEHAPGVLQGLVALHLGVRQGRSTAAVLVAGGPVGRGRTVFGSVGM